MIPDARLRRWVRAAIRAGRPPLPIQLVWSWFVALHAARTYGMAGPNPISFVEIEAYARLHRWPMEPRHVEVIRALDEEWLRQATEALPADSKPAAPRSSGQAISPASFDAAFG